MTDLDVQSPPGVSPDKWAAALTAVRAYCGWHIAPSITEEVEVDGPGGTLLCLPTLHLTALTDVTNAGTPVADPEWSRSGMVRGCWTSRFRGVTATMTHGYDQMPAQVLAVASSLARSAAPVGVRQQMSGPHSVTWTDSALAGEVGLSDMQAAALAPYVIPSRP